MTSAIFWLRPQILGGRPGPDREPWSVQELLSFNVRRVLSVNDGLLVHPEDLSDVGIDYACFPLPDNVPPQSGDVERSLSTLASALEFALKPLKDGGSVLTHCSSGKDRTGLFLCYYLVRTEGFSPDAAIDEVKRIRPIALSADGWEDFARTVLYRAAT